jgi:hypothetical protein
VFADTTADPRKTSVLPRAASRRPLGVLCPPLAASSMSLGGRGCAQTPSYPWLQNRYLIDKIR